MLNMMYDISTVEKQIISKDYSFYMRTCVDKDAHVKNKKFSEDRFRYSYLLDDMAGLIDNNHIAAFLRNNAERFRENRHGQISEYELSLLKTFLNDAYPTYKDIEYIDIEEVTITTDKKLKSDNV